MVTPDPKFDLDPREQQDVESVKATQAKIDYDLDRDRFVEKQVELAKTTLICGICVGKVIWDRKKSTIKSHNWDADSNDVANGVVDAVQAREVIEKDGPTLLSVNLWDFFPQPGPTAIEAVSYTHLRAHETN